MAVPQNMPALSRSEISAPFSRFLLDRAPQMRPLIEAAPNFSAAERVILRSHGFMVQGLADYPRMANPTLGFGRLLARFDKQFRKCC